MRPEDAQTKILSSVHAPGPVRVLGPLSNSRKQQNTIKSLDHSFITINVPVVYMVRDKIILPGEKSLKGLSHEIDFKNFEKNLQNLA
jgi:hypothetical protein